MTSDSAHKNPAPRLYAAAPDSCSDAASGGARFFAPTLYLEKLAERYGLSKVATIEKLVLEAHDLHYYCGDDDGRFMKGKCDCQFLKKYEERRG